MKAFTIAISFLVLFFFALLFFNDNTTSHTGSAIEQNAPVENIMQTQKQAESIQKNILLPNKKQVSESKDSFKSYVKEAVEQLPTPAQARAEVELNPHDTPESVMKAGAVIGYVADQMKADKKNVDSGLKFFKNCAQSNSVASTIRAVCLRNLVDFSSRYQNNVRVSFADYPEDIQRIARHIPRLR